MGILILLNMNLYAYQNSYSVKEFEDIVLKGGGLKVNNFMISEKRDMFSGKLISLEISYSIRNKSSKSRNFSISFIGMGWAWGGDSPGIGWAMSSKPMMGMVGAGKAESVNTSIFVDEKVLKSTEWIQVIVTTDGPLK